MKKIYKVPTSKNLYLIKNCLFFYKVLYQMNQKWSLFRYIAVVIFLNINYIFNISSKINFVDIEPILSNNSKVYLLKMDQEGKLVIFSREENINFLYKFFDNKDNGYKNELKISTNLRIENSSTILIPEIVSKHNYKNWNIIKFKINSFLTLNQNKSHKKFLEEYKKFHCSYLNELNIIHNDLSPWNVAFYERKYEIFDWEFKINGPIENDLFWFFLTSKLDFTDLNIDLSNLNPNILSSKLQSLGSSRHDKKIIKKFEKFKKTYLHNL